MKIVNHGNLPAPLHDAIVRSMLKGYADADLPDENEDDLPTVRVSSLVKPSRAVVLEKAVNTTGELVVSSEESIFALIGTVIHRIIAEYQDNQLATDHIIEQRLDTTIFLGGDHFYPESHTPEGTPTHFRLTGRPDYLCLVDGKLSDWKMASVWEALLEDPVRRMERTLQLNAYALLLRAKGYEITGLSNWMLFRDWSKSKAGREHNYPDKQVMEVEQELWDEGTTIDRIIERAIPLLRPYMDNSELPQCTDEERWIRGGRYAVMRPGRKSALGLGQTEEEAMAKARKNNSEKVMSDPGITVELRPIDPIRCRLYCYAMPWCSQAKADGIVPPEDHPSAFDCSPYPYE